MSERKMGLNLVGSNFCPLITYAYEHNACAVANATRLECANSREISGNTLKVKKPLKD